MSQIILGFCILVSSITLAEATTTGAKTIADNIESSQKSIIINR